MKSTPRDTPTERLASMRRSAAEQVAPMLALHSQLTGSWKLDLDMSDARARMRRGTAAVQPLAVLSRAGDLDVPYIRATKAIERTGLASNEEAARARQHRHEIHSLIAAWLDGTSGPAAPGTPVARRAAALVANSVLRRASMDLGAELPLQSWSRTTCPCCGSFPEFASGTGARTRLVCARCDSVWHAATSGCVGCGAHLEPDLARIYSRALDYHLTICNACGRYLKQCESPLDVDPLVERAFTALLDTAAEERGLRL